MTRRQAAGELELQLRHPVAAHHEQALAVSHRLSILRQDLDDRTADISLDLVHQLHGLNDTKGLSPLDKITHLDVGICIRVGGPIEGADDR